MRTNGDDVIVASDGNDIVSVGAATTSLRRGWQRTLHGGKAYAIIGDEPTASVAPSKKNTRCGGPGDDMRPDWAATTP